MIATPSAPGGLCGLALGGGSHGITPSKRLEKQAGKFRKNATRGFFGPSYNLVLQNKGGPLIGSRAGYRLKFQLKKTLEIESSAPLPTPQLHPKGFGRKTQTRAIPLTCGASASDCCPGSSVGVMRVRSGGRTCAIRESMSLRPWSEELHLRGTKRARDVGLRTPLTRAPGLDCRGP